MSPTPGQHFHSNGLAFLRLFNNETGYEFQSTVFICESVVNQARKSRSFACNQNRNTSQKQYKCITTVFVDMRLWKTKHPWKRFRNFRQSYVLLTYRIEIHQSQPLA